MLKIDWVRKLIEIGFVAYSESLKGQVDDPVSDLFLVFTEERYKHDFEYWAYTCIKIQDKESLEDVPFKLRRGQRKLLAKLESQRLAGIPIRVILLKARQWGGSTLVQIYMMWIQQIHKTNWHMAICAQDDNASKNINEMYTRAAEMYPTEMGTITLKPYARSSKNRICAETGGIIGVGSYLNPNQFRSYNYPMTHQSELGLWEDTLKRKAANVAQSLRNSVPNVPYSVIVMESTAKGVGTFFHNEWIAATEGNSRYIPVFVGTWEIELYQAEIMDHEKFVDEMSDYDWFMWNLGATLEAINWYKLYKSGENYTDWQMQEEFPNTSIEAFVASGQKVFNPEYIQAVSKDCMKPEFIGDVFGNKRIGKEALKGIRLTEVINGSLWIWVKPDNTARVMNRYAAFADIGGRTSKADYSVLRIVDRLWMIDGGDPEFILTWRGHLDQDLFAWKCVQICMAYAIPEIGSYPLLAIESNSLKKDKDEGDHFFTVLDQISDFYPNLYVRNDIEKIGNSFIPKYGFQTNAKTKGMIIDAHNSCARERFLATLGQQEGWGYIERDQRAVNEMNWYEVKRDGSLGAVDGRNDDIEICTAGCLWLATQHMDKPFYVVEERGSYSRSKVKRESSF